MIHKRILALFGADEESATLVRLIILLHAEFMDSLQAGAIAFLLLNIAEMMAVKDTMILEVMI